MKILIVGDIQADPSNLDRCKQLQKKVNEIVKKLKISAIVQTGDFKQQYDPVSVDVVNWATAWIREAGVPFYIDLGNHDRQTLYRDDKNWFETLRSAGAHCAEEPIRGTKEFPVSFLPYRHDLQQLRDGARFLAEAKNKKGLLIFHAELKNSSLNASRSSNSPFSVADLFPDRYDFCIGGHLHAHQRLGPGVYYVGSPFPMDWGEANQEKKFAIYDTEEGKLEFLPTGFPGWYDPLLPNYQRPESWEGTRVRLHISQTRPDLLEKARELAAREYGGAEIIVQSKQEVEEQAPVQGIDPSLSDVRKVAAYVERTLPENLSKHKKVVLAYLTHILARHAPASNNEKGIRFEGVTAENVLSYKKVSFAFEKGLTVLCGEIGQGKTSLLSLPSIALFGSTLKGQEHNSWIHRWADGGSALVDLFLSSSQGETYVIRRCRNPRRLQIFMGDEDISKGKNMAQVQDQIENLIGMSWEVFTNTLYVDQRRENLMLTGTNKERKQFLARMNNLERFAVAQEFVKEQRDKLQAAIEESAKSFVLSQHEIAVLKQGIDALKSVTEPEENPEDFQKLIVEHEERNDIRKNHIAGLLKVSQEWVSRVREETEKEAELYQRQGDYQGVVMRLSGLQGERQCPTCMQPVSKEHVQRHIGEYSKKMKNVETLMQHRRENIERMNKKIETFRDRKGCLEKKIIESNTLVRTYKEQLASRTKKQANLKARVEHLTELRVKVATLEKSNTENDVKHKKMERQMVLLKYAFEAFGRNGIPAFLLASLVPRLNRAAAYYSEKFSNGEIKVRFVVDPEGEADVQIDNQEGGETAADQSGGETRISSLIISFALREDAKTNILILDEPAWGLGPKHARQFAQSLSEIVPRFGCVLLTTHSPDLLSGLAPERVIRVEKKKGVSSLVNEDERFS